MLKFRDLGINALPRGGYRMGGECRDRTDGCGEGSGDLECLGCTGTDKRCDDCSHPTLQQCNDCTTTVRPDRYHAAGFTDDAVALLRQQLDQQLSY
jgi:hypothetical protein